MKYHLLIELKLQEFSHENIGQLNTYLSWYAASAAGLLVVSRERFASIGYDYPELSTVPFRATIFYRFEAY
jgi:hypothetical protein